jgi:hypothetical protein
MEGLLSFARRPGGVSFNAGQFRRMFNPILPDSACRRKRGVQAFPGKEENKNYERFDCILTFIKLKFILIL